MTAMYNNQRQGKPKVHQWAEKLAQGEAFERRVIELFGKQGHQAWKPNERTYDLYINLEVPYWGTYQVTGECKYDAMASSTGNLALQTWDGGKPRGIHPKGPNPDLWIHGVGDEAWVIKTKILQGVVETYGLKAIATGDAGMRARCVLLPLQQAKKIVGGQWLSL